VAAHAVRDDQQEILGIGAWARTNGKSRRDVLVLFPSGGVGHRGDR
jgi:hypothetical protein